MIVFQSLNVRCMPTVCPAPCCNRKEWIIPPCSCHLLRNKKAPLNLMTQTITSQSSCLVWRTCIHDCTLLLPASSPPWGQFGLPPGMWWAPKNKCHTRKKWKLLDP